MAVQRLSLSNIATLVKQAIGVDSSTNAFWESDANLYLYINQAGQNIPVKVALVVAPDDPTAVVVVDFWRTKANSATSGTGVVVTAGNSTGYLPVDYYHWESFYDLTSKKKLSVISSTASRDRVIELIRKRPAGPPEAIEILDMATNGANWQRKFQFIPDTLTGVTPSVELVYYRLPASMAGSTPATEYPDAPVEFHTLWVDGAILELMAPSNPNYDRYKARYDETIQALARQAKVLR